jgi:predicted RNA-binding protein with PIN domain
MTVYLVDGYNLIHQLLRPASSDPRTEPSERHLIPNLDDERSRMIDQIASFMGSRDDRAIIVFDSQNEALQKTETATSKVEVYFGSFDRSADSIIEREVYTLFAGENVVVVTSDWGLQKVVFRPNVVRCSSRQFLRDLQAHTKKIANSRDCTTMGNRVEDRIAPGMLDKLKALREQLEDEPPG